MVFLGSKKKRFYKEELIKFIPKDIQIYVEPFGGSFAVAGFINKPFLSVYNDINTYDLKIKADYIHHLDYKEIFKLYDDEDTVFFLDPPYFKLEYLYVGCEDYTKDFHIELKKEIDKLKGTVIITYNNDRFIKSLYEGYNIHRCQGIYHKEIIITKKASI